MLNEPLLPELSLLTEGQREARGSFFGQMLREIHGDSRRIWRGEPMGRRTGSASEKWGLNQASLCGSNCYGANVGMYSQCFRVLRSHCDRRALTRQPPSSKEPLSREPSWPSPSPSLADPEHTSSLAAGVGEQRQLCWRRKIPPEPDCSNCLMFCICLHLPSQWQPPTQFLLESLLLSLITTCSHIHTNTHGCVPSLAHFLPSIHKAKIATDTLMKEADWTASCSPPPLMTALKATQSHPHFLRRSSWEPVCGGREMSEWALAHPLYLSWLKEPDSWKLQGT